MIPQLKLQKDRWQIPNEIQTELPKEVSAQTHSKIFMKYSVLDIILSQSR